MSIESFGNCNCVIGNCEFVGYDICGNAICLENNNYSRYCADVEKGCKWKMKNKKKKLVMVFDNEKQLRKCLKLFEREI